MIHKVFASRVHVVARALVAVTAEVACGSPPGPAGLQPGQFRGYNVLLVTIDTLRADRIGAYGSTLGVTPTLDRGSFVLDARFGLNAGFDVYDDRMLGSGSQLEVVQRTAEQVLAPATWSSEGHG